MHQAAGFPLLISCEEGKMAPRVPEQVLKRYWGYDTFREPQKDVIQARWPPLSHACAAHAENRMHESKPMHSIHNFACASYSALGS